MRPRYWFCVNAGGAARRMGPWAPRLKPFLPIGPANADGEHEGPCVVERVLRNYRSWLTHRPDMDGQVQLVIATGNSPMVLADWLEVFGTSSLAEGVLLVPDAPGFSGPMALARQAPDGVSLVLHNGDDLIARRALHNFLDHALSDERRQRPYATSTVLMTAAVVQRGAFGEVISTPHGFKVEEKPVIKECAVGCGVLYLATADIDYAKNLQTCNSSTMLTALELAYANGKRGQFAPPVTFPIPSHYWATIGNPEEYLNACASPAWTDDENMKAWRTANGA